MCQERTGSYRPNCGHWRTFADILQADIDLVGKTAVLEF